MNRDCTTVLPLLLEAEPDELRGQGASALATHLRGCASCAAWARLVLDAEAALDAHLDSAPAGFDFDAVLAAANAPPAPGRKARLPAWGRWSGLAAAAAAAALLLLADGEPPPLPAVARAAAPPPVVEAAPGHTVAVMATRDPDITVLWFFDR